MKNSFAIVGGDLRIVHLAKMLANDGKMVYLYGLEKTKEKINLLNVNYCNTVEEVIKNAEVIISSIPFSKDGINIYAPFSNEAIKIEKLANCLENKTLFAGSISDNFYKLVKNKKLETIDLMEQEDLTVLNTIATAEGAISDLITNTETILHGSKVLILGFGRVAKVLAKKLVGLNVNVTCAARKDKDFAWIKALGYNLTNINTLSENLNQYDIIINTVPHLILNEEKLAYVKKDCLLMDLASKPGGIDQEICERRELKFIWSLAIPGKVAPVTSAEFIKNTIYNIIRKEKIDNT